MIPLSRGVCKECGRECLIVNKKYSLCNSCNRKRLGRKDNVSHIKTKFLKSSSIKRKAKKPTGERELFIEIWEERPHYCEHCGVFLGDEPLLHFFAHEKSKGSHPELRLVKTNIHLWCHTCHYLHDFGSRVDFDKRKKR